MNYALFLDDIRFPPEKGTWVIARNFAQAVNIVLKNGYPKFISFDHDLGDDSPTGYDFAKWLVERDLDVHDMPKDFSFTVHSANPVGAQNIANVLNRYLQFKNERS
jgi:hypothetical protein